LSRARIDSNPVLAVPSQKRSVDARVRVRPESAKKSRKKNEDFEKVQNLSLYAKRKVQNLHMKMEQRAKAECCAV
jgi:hypothetical protein